MMATNPYPTVFVNNLRTAPVVVRTPAESFSASSSANSWSSVSTSASTSASTNSSRSNSGQFSVNPPIRVTVPVVNPPRLTPTPFPPVQITVPIVPRPPVQVQVNPLPAQRNNSANTNVINALAVGINQLNLTGTAANMVLTAAVTGAVATSAAATAPAVTVPVTPVWLTPVVSSDPARGSASSFASHDSIYSLSSDSSSASASASTQVNDPPPLSEDDQELYDIIMSMLIDDQPEHVQNALRIYRCGGFGGSESKIVMDASPPGCGKTHTTCAIAALLHLDLYVVAEKSQLGFWHQVAPLYGVYIVDAVTYSSLSGNRYFLDRAHVHVPPKRGNGAGRYETRFTATQAWLDLLYGYARDPYGNVTESNRPILVVFDECQNIKNMTDKTRAVQALVAPLLPPPRSAVPRNQVAQFVTGPDGVPRPPSHQLPPSVAMFCSGNPFDKEEMAVNFLRTFGLYTEDRLCRHDIQAGMVYDGFQEIMGNIRRLVPDADLTDGISLMNRGKKTGELQKQVFTWFERYLKPKWMIEMNPPDIEAQLDVKAGYYSIPLGRSGQYGDLLMELMGVMNYDMETGIIGEEEQGARGVLFSIMPQLERFKVEDVMIPQGLHILNTTAKDKVVFFVSSLDSIDTLVEAFCDWQPLVLSGSVSSKVRTQRIDLFRDSPHHRVFITNLATGATGISLDDTVGDAPRHSFIIPIHSIEKVAQAVRRIYRRNTKSLATVRVIFINIDVSEQGLLDALAKKSEVYKRLLSKQVRRGMIFPGDYPVIKYGQTVKVKLERLREED